MLQITFNHYIFHIATVTPDWEPYDSNDKSEFPHPVHHHPMAVSLLQLRDDDAEPDVQVKVISKGISDLKKEERGLVRTFFQKVPGNVNSLVSFNGRSFAIPVMVYRALHHGVDATKYLQEAGGLFGRSPSSTPHIDLSESLSGYGAMYKSASLSNYAMMLGLSKRPYLDVSQAFSSGNVNSIVMRLEVDVLITAIIYYRLLLSQGWDRKAYEKTLNSTLEAYAQRNELAENYILESKL